MLFGSDTFVYWEESNLGGGSLKMVQCLRGIRKKMSQIKKNPLPTCDCIN